MFRLNIFKINPVQEFNFIIFVLKNFFILYSFSDIYKFTLTMKSCPINLTVFINKQLGYIYNKTVNFYKSRFLFINELVKTLKQFFMISYIKMRYKGKGYKIYFKKLRCIYLRFGFSHKNYVYNINNFSKFYIK
jgi:hypothetical protein